MVVSSVPCVPAAVDEVALGHQLAADTPAHRSGDASELDVELGGVDRGAGRRDAGFGLSHGGGTGLRLFLGHRLALHQGAGTSEELLREIHARLRQLEIALRPAQLRLVGARVDREQEVALSHQGALAKVDRLQVAADAGADLHGIDRLESCRVLVPVDELALHGARDGHLGRRRFLGLLAAARCDGERRHAQRKIRAEDHESLQSVNAGGLPDARPPGRATDTRTPSTV
jgi:hypothetical protein